MSKETCVEGCVNIQFWEMHAYKDTYAQTTTIWNKQTKKNKRKFKKAKAQTGILPLKHQVWVNANQTCNQPFWLRFISMKLEEDVTRWKEMIQRQTGETSGKVDTRTGWSLNHHEWFLFSCPCVRWETASLLWYWPLTWLCMNLRLIPSSVTWSSPPSPVFMSWTGNSPPSSGPAGNQSSLQNMHMQYLNFKNLHVLVD